MAEDSDKIKELLNKLKAKIEQNPQAAQEAFDEMAHNPASGLTLKGKSKSGAMSIRAAGNPEAGWDICVRPDHGHLHLQARIKGQSDEYPYNVVHVTTDQSTIELVQNLISAGISDPSQVRKSMAGSETRYLIVQRGGLLASNVAIGDPPLATVAVPPEFFTVASMQMGAPPEEEELPDEEDDDHDDDDDGEPSIS